VQTHNSQFSEQRSLEQSVARQALFKAVYSATVILLLLLLLLLLLTDCSSSERDLCFSDCSVVVQYWRSSQWSWLLA
jgi:uncharacterized integral membrane protein